MKHDKGQPDSTEKGKRTQGQSAAELAIFGSLLMFVISLFVRTGFSAGMQMSGQLKAQRYAFSESYRGSERQYTGGKNCDCGGACTDAFEGKKDFCDSAARNNANILLVEDRLTINAGKKQDTRDRVPIFANASGTFSKNLFLPVDEEEDPESAETWSYPVFDMIINGQRFVFRINSRRNIPLRMSNLPICAGYLPGGEDPRCWESHCLRSTEWFIPFRRWDRWSTAKQANKTAEGYRPYLIPEDILGCPVIYKVVANNAPGWCTGLNEAGGREPCPENIADGDIRFDLDFDHTTDPDNDFKGDLSRRQTFSWQWVKMPVIPEGRRNDIVMDAFDWETFDWSSSPSSEGTNMYEILNAPNQRNYKELEENEDADIDGDFWEEKALILTFEDHADGYDAVINVLYRNKGELDFSGRDDGASGLKTEDMQMYSYTYDADIITVGAYSYPDLNNPRTYLQISEGKLYDTTTNSTRGQFVRSTTRQDHVDIIQRRIVFRKTPYRPTGDDKYYNTNAPESRFCEPPPSRTPRVWGNSKFAAENAVYGIDNPVRVCVEPVDRGEVNLCFGGEALPDGSDIMENTCLVRQSDDGTKPAQIFVRSRLKDIRGRRWTTRID